MEIAWSRVLAIAWSWSLADLVLEVVAAAGSGIWSIELKSMLTEETSVTEESQSTGRETLFSVTCLLGLVLELELEIALKQLDLAPASSSLIPSGVWSMST